MEPVAAMKQSIISKLHLQPPSPHSTESPNSLFDFFKIFFILDEKQVFISIQYIK
jgi:hypothetical protein